MRGHSQWIRRVLNTAAAGRRLARRIVLVQVIVTGSLAALFLAVGGREAMGAAMGGLAVTLGGALMAWRTFAGAPSGPELALFRLFVGAALKWSVVVLVLYLALAKWALDPLAVFSGVLAALLVNLAAIGFRN